MLFFVRLNGPAQVADFDFANFGTLLPRLHLERLAKRVCPTVDLFGLFIGLPGLIAVVLASTARVAVGLAAAGEHEGAEHYDHDHLTLVHVHPPWWVQPCISHM